jgi:hypothetical protein
VYLLTIYLAEHPLFLLDMLLDVTRDSSCLMVRIFLRGGMCQTISSNPFRIQDTEKGTNQIKGAKTFTPPPQLGPYLDRTYPFFRFAQKYSTSQTARGEQCQHGTESHHLFLCPRLSSSTARSVTTDDAYVLRRQAGQKKPYFAIGNPRILSRPTSNPGELALRGLRVRLISCISKHTYPPLSSREPLSTAAAAPLATQASASIPPTAQPKAATISRITVPTTSTTCNAASKAPATESAVTVSG